MSSPLVTAHRKGFPDGFTWITSEGEPEVDTGIDFGILRVRSGEVVEETTEKETALLLMRGDAAVFWDGRSGRVHRRSLFDEAPFVLHVPAGTRVRLAGSGVGSEWAVSRTRNPRPFEPRLFEPDDVAPEYRGAGLVQGACLRNVRLVFDGRLRPEAELVLGEVVNYPGRWSSYPPHHHPQPEIYHYRFTEPQGYGHAELGDEVFRVRTGDTLKITGGLSHAQVSAPGYGMWYLWVVRHLPGNRYTGFTFDAEHEWVLDPRKQGWEPEGDAS